MMMMTIIIIVINIVNLVILSIRGAFQTNEIYWLLILSVIKTKLKPIAKFRQITPDTQLKTAVNCKCNERYPA